MVAQAPRQCSPSKFLLETAACGPLAHHVVCGSTLKIPVTALHGEHWRISLLTDLDVPSPPPSPVQHRQPTSFEVEMGPGLSVT